MNKGLDLMGNSLEQRTVVSHRVRGKSMAEDMIAKSPDSREKSKQEQMSSSLRPIYEMRTLELLAKRAEAVARSDQYWDTTARSYRHAEFLHNEIPAWRSRKTSESRSVPRETKRQRWEFRSRRIFSARQSILSPVRPHAPFKKYDVVPQILEALSEVLGVWYAEPDTGYPRRGSPVFLQSFP